MPRFRRASGAAKRTVLLRNLLAGQEVEGEDDDVGDDVSGAHAVEDKWIVEGNLLRDLHHAEHDDEVGSGGRFISSEVQLGNRISGLRW